MKLQQLRYALEVLDQNLNVSAAAASLYTAQSGISKQIRLLEQELGVALFVRSGKRIAGVTHEGRELLERAKRVLREVDNLKQAGKDYSAKDQGMLTIATTHTQASYMLPAVITEFVRRFPKVKLSLRQGSSLQVADMVAGGLADIGIAGNSLAERKDLTSVLCFEWNRCLIAPAGHPVLRVKSLTLEELARHPLVTYNHSVTGHSSIDEAFGEAGLSANVVLTALDADVIKRYVRLGIGVGIVAQMAFDKNEDRGLRNRDVTHLFKPGVTRLAVRKSSFLREFQCSFIEMFAPHVRREHFAPNAV